MEKPRLKAYDEYFADPPLPRAFYYPSKEIDIDEQLQATLSPSKTVPNDTRREPVWEPTPSHPISDGGVQAGTFSWKPMPGEDAWSPPTSDKYNESWPSSSEVISENGQHPPEAIKYNSSTRKDKDAAVLSSGDSGSTISKYLARFRHGKPLSREERTRALPKSSGEFWWLGLAPGGGNGLDTIPERDGPSTHVEKMATNSSEADLNSVPSTPKQISSPVASQGSRAVSSLPGDQSPNTKAITERADKMLELSSGSSAISSPDGVPGKSLSTPPVSSDTSGSSVQSSEKSSNISYSTPLWSRQPRHALVPNTPKEFDRPKRLATAFTRMNPQDDILEHWRARRKMETASALVIDAEHRERAARLQKLREQIALPSSFYHEGSIHQQPVVGGGRPATDREAATPMRTGQSTTTAGRAKSPSLILSKSSSTMAGVDQTTARVKVDAEVQAGPCGTDDDELTQRPKRLLTVPPARIDTSCCQCHNIQCEDQCGNSVHCTPHCTASPFHVSAIYPPAPSSSGCCSRHACQDTAASTAVAAGRGCSCCRRTLSSGGVTVCRSTTNRNTGRCHCPVPMCATHKMHDHYAVGNHCGRDLKVHHADEESEEHSVRSNADDDEHLEEQKSSYESDRDIPGASVVQSGVLQGGNREAALGMCRSSAGDTDGTSVGENAANTRDEILGKVVGQTISERLFVPGAHVAADATNGRSKTSEEHMNGSLQVASAADSGCELLQAEGDEVLAMLLRKRDVLQAQLRIIEQRLQQ